MALVAVMSSGSPKAVVGESGSAWSSDMPLVFQSCNQLELKSNLRLIECRESPAWMQYLHLGTSTVTHL
eukprot:118769-Hanusia_phi.AAC.4